LTVITDILAHLSDNWNVSVTSKPKLYNGYKMEKWEAEKYIFVYNPRTNLTDADLSGSLEDRVYNIRMILGTSRSESVVNKLLSEVRRIFAIVMTGYIYNRVVLYNPRHASDRWRFQVNVEIKQYLKNKGS